ncbi:MAG: bifunctional riboflavin kinase/FAD synthetase [Actinobacteria bacterium]|nr:bifunctional riboflavin kinase/FAD synthetase [Actinomycetota bacterium]
MYRWQGLDEVPADWRRSVVTIGVFDGVHRGHQRIISRVVADAAGLGLPAVVVTFDPHPLEVVRPGSHPLLLCTLRRRVQLLGQLGVDAVCVLPFTKEFSQLKAEEFGQVVLADRLHAQRVVVGRDFRFGNRAAGDVALLAELGEKHDFVAEGLDLLADRGDRVSSTKIRQLLADGDVAGAAGGLSRPHRVEGTVVEGQRRGRALGFPTANLRASPQVAIPGDGVYAGWLVRLGEQGQERERWPAALSVGTNPTFGGAERTVEAYALDRDDLDLYGAEAAVDFAARLRGQARFGSAGALVTQMRQDVDRARTLVGQPAR